MSFKDQVASFLDEAGISYQRDVPTSEIGSRRSEPMVTATATADITAPHDATFGGHAYTEAADLEALGEYLVKTVEEFSALQMLTIAYRWKAQGGKSKGQPRAGGTETIGTQTLAFIVDDEDVPDLLVWLAADTVSASGWTTRQIEAALYDQLAAIHFDENGKMTLVGPDIIGRAATIRRYSAWNDMLQTAAEAFQQLRLDDA